MKINVTNKQNPILGIAMPRNNLGGMKSARFLW